MTRALDATGSVCTLAVPRLTLTATRSAVTETPNAASPAVAVTSGAEMVSCRPVCTSFLTITVPSSTTRSVSGLAAGSAMMTFDRAPMIRL